MAPVFAFLLPRLTSKTRMQTSLDVRLLSRSAMRWHDETRKVKRAVAHGERYVRVGNRKAIWRTARNLMKPQFWVEFRLTGVIGGRRAWHFRTLRGSAKLASFCNVFWEATARNVSTPSSPALHLLAVTQRVLRISSHRFIRAAIIW